MFTRASKFVALIGTAIVAGGAASAAHAQVRVYVPPRYQTPVLPTGACCRADGTCISSTVIGCSVLVGTAVYRGNGTTCNPSPCTAVLMTPVQPAGQNFYPVGVSGDGNTVIGTSSNSNSQYAAGVWRASTNWALTTANGYAGAPTGVSYDGSKVVGAARGAYAASGYQWTVGQAGIYLLAQPAQSSVRPRAISPDGLFIVGTWLNSSGVSRAASWTNNGTILSNLGVPSGSPTPPIAEACTNGHRYAGFSGTTAGSTSFRDLIALPDLPGGANVSVALDMSSSGDVVVGYGSIIGATHAVRWDASGIVQDLHNTSIGLTNSLAVDCTADGQTVVGNASSGSTRAAFIWRGSSGMIKLRDYLITRFPGVYLGGISYNNVTGISDDGRTICGYDDVPESTYKMGWIVRLSSAPQ